MRKRSEAAAATAAETSAVIDFDSTYIDEVFGDTGIFAAAIPGYFPRPGQVQLARAVDARFRSPGTLLAEAPTGVGKSLAYGVPATRFAAAGKKVVIVTANIALQEQLVRKDLPMLERVLPWKFKFELAKGFSNYLCGDAVHDAQVDRVGGKRLRTVEEDQQFEQLLNWAERTQTGDLSELTFEPTAGVRRLVTIARDDCIGKTCDHFDGCFPRVARRRLECADVVVTNYHLYFADLSIKRASGGAGVLPNHDLVVFDEGHKAASIARDFFGVRATAGSVQRAASLLGGAGRAQKFGIPALDPDLREELNGRAMQVFGRLRQLYDSGDYVARIKTPGQVPHAELGAALDRAASVYEHAASHMAFTAEAQRALMAAASRCREILRALDDANAVAQRDKWVYHLEEDGPDRAALLVTPLRASEFLRASLFTSGDDGRPSSQVVTSATLAVGRSETAFDYIASELGCEDGAEELVVESPFDYSRCLFVVPRLHDPNERDFANDVCQTLHELVLMAGGRTLGLFTSYRLLEQAATYLRRQKLPFDVLTQGTAPRTLLLEQFRKDEQSILLGCESFWEGVDVPGPSLSAVLMDRLPFDHMEDPFVDAVRESDPRNWWLRYCVPRAIVRFRQGFGRLIRSVDDSGVVVACDRRLCDRPYGRRFLRSLPAAVVVSRRLEEARSFLPAA